jgi:hypothetical protein
MSGLNILLKIKYSFYSALVFFLVANPEAYKLTQLFFGSYIPIATGGCPTTAGFFIHTAVFFVVIAALMMIPRER